MDSVRTMRRLASGDPEALRSLYDAYGRAVFTVCLRSLGDRTLAEDATQQTFIQAWRAAATFDQERDPAPWLYAIARRAAVDTYRRERRHRQPLTLEERGEDRDIAVLPPSFEGMWEAWEVRLAVDRLSDEEQAVVRATFFHGLTHQETAESLGIPIGTVKSRAHRAHRHLADLLAHVREATA
ncbi:MAG TPA: sigma-70 family RNA polymerase sigma factor [Acidimicrobiia bacterium]|nr:sigma-70 family RNA polymerase sigma factor [Acidimicrobiia bacterium]